MISSILGNQRIEFLHTREYKVRRKQVKKLYDSLLPGRESSYDICPYPGLRIGIIDFDEGTVKTHDCSII